MFDLYARKLARKLAMCERSFNISSTLRISAVTTIYHIPTLTAVCSNRFSSLFLVPHTPIPRFELCGLVSIAYQVFPSTLPFDHICLDILSYHVSICFDFDLGRLWSLLNSKHNHHHLLPLYYASKWTPWSSEWATQISSDHHGLSEMPREKVQGMPWSILSTSQLMSISLVLWRTSHLSTMCSSRYHLRILRTPSPRTKFQQTFI